MEKDKESWVIWEVVQCYANQSTTPIAPCTSFNKKHKRELQKLKYMPISSTFLQL